jgi:hypothetical protein
MASASELITPLFGFSNAEFETSPDTLVAVASKKNPTEGIDAYSICNLVYGAGSSRFTWARRIYPIVPTPFVKNSIQQTIANYPFLLGLVGGPLFINRQQTYLAYNVDTVSGSPTNGKITVSLQVPVVYTYQGKTVSQTFTVGFFENSSNIIQLPFAYIDPVTKKPAVEIKNVVASLTYVTSYPLAGISVNSTLTPYFINQFFQTNANVKGSFISISLVFSAEFDLTSPVQYPVIVDYGSVQRFEDVKAGRSGYKICGNRELSFAAFQFQSRPTFSYNQYTSYSKLPRGNNQIENSVSINNLENSPVRNQLFIGSLLK